VLCGCAKEPTGPELLAQVRQALTDRDARLDSFQFDATSTALPSGETVNHSFYFRSPNKMRAVLAKVERSFDGTTLYEVSAGKKTFTAFALKLPPPKASLLLHTTFAPFVPEGFRTPLMPMKGVTAQKTGRNAVELSMSPGEGVTVTYRLRWPGGDFLEKRTVSPSGRTTLKMEFEHCDAALKLCVPQDLGEFLDGVRVVGTSLHHIGLNPALSADSFVPAAPEGFTREARELVEE